MEREVARMPVDEKLNNVPFQRKDFPGKGIPSEPIPLL